MELSKQQVIAQINRIAAMNEDELNEYTRAVSLSQVDDKARSFIYRACDERMYEIGLSRVAQFVNGDIDADFD